MTTRAYIWWMNDPWAALVAMAAIILLLSTLAIGVILFSYSRYMKFIKQYRIYQNSYDGPEFVEPPSFLREYETQSLNMYVPPDEGLQEVGEINMIFRPEEGLPTLPPGTRLPSTIGSRHGVASATNPIFRGEANYKSASYIKEDTTIL